MANQEVLKQNILDFASKLSAEKLSITTTDTISIKVDNGAFLATKPGCNVNTLTEDDLQEYTIADAPAELALHAAIYSAREDINAIIHTHSQFCCSVGDSGKTIPAVLDDMAQIIGPSAKLSKANAPSTVVKTLKGRNACLIKGDGVIATGRTLDEAFTGSLVLEKAAKVYLEAAYLGGAKPINIFEATLMHYIFKKKYSKKDQAAKLSEMEDK